MTYTKIATAVGHYEQVIPSELIDLMVKEVDEIEFECFSEASIGDSNNSKIETKTRDSKISWWYETHWVSSIFSHYFNLANKNYWEYDLTHIEGIQITSYDVGEHYSWHSDYGLSNDPNHTRKLSATLLVTDPSEFEGGDLEFIDYHGKTVVAPRIKGTMIIFDSRIPHRVTPVTKGKRISLVSWIFGPKLK
jgi:PKHD-type hydroxylase